MAVQHTSHLPFRLKQYIPADQHFITLVKKHPIGLIYLYAAVIGGAAALMVIAAAAAPDLLGAVSGREFTMLSAVGILLMVLVVFILILVTSIYTHNSLVITDKETIQILQRGVFQLKVSHLSHADIEDVTAEQNGLLATVLDYGTLHIETSGEQRNFAFTYCPDPDRYARVVLEARQKFTETTGG